MFDGKGTAPEIAVEGVLHFVTAQGTVGVGFRKQLVGAVVAQGSHLAPLGDALGPTSSIVAVGHRGGRIGVADLGEIAPVAARVGFLEVILVGGGGATLPDARLQTTRLGVGVAGATGPSNAARCHRVMLGGQPASVSIVVPGGGGLAAGATVVAPGGQCAQASLRVVGVFTGWGEGSEDFFDLPGGIIFVLGFRRTRIVLDPIGPQIGVVVVRRGDRALPHFMRRCGEGGHQIRIVVGRRGGAVAQVFEGFGPAMLIVVQFKFSEDRAVFGFPGLFLQATVNIFTDQLGVIGIDGRLGADLVGGIPGHVGLAGHRRQGVFKGQVPDLRAIDCPQRFVEQRGRAAGFGVIDFFLPPQDRLACLGGDIVGDFHDAINAVLIDHPVPVEVFHGLG